MIGEPLREGKGVFWVPSLTTNLNGCLNIKRSLLLLQEQRDEQLDTHV